MEFIYACEEHIDEAMDEVINEKETFPVINEVLEKKCSYCNKGAKYEVKMIQ
ncbi:CxxH/CxxC protein [Clostridium sp.]|uniref:CxxH/CxxC protein n=1 Tax=Clostridium sp. TaxID=1506 RepID=UPI0025C1093E|nr:CxxH/CxxC protein [Clostridium sp.]MCI9303533.1 CxxH/CxxC protein [Clostridium sp.]